MKKMTVRALVQDELNRHFPEPLTNWQLAERLGLPTPSVRRATLQLRQLAQIRNAGMTVYDAALYTGVPMGDAPSSL